MGRRPRWFSAFHKVLEIVLHLHSATGITCPPGKGVKNGTCKVCGVRQVSPGGLNAVCTPCPPPLIANANNTTCVQFGKCWLVSLICGLAMLLGCELGVDRRSWPGHLSASAWACSACQTSYQQLSPFATPRCPLANLAAICTLSQVSPVPLARVFRVSSARRAARTRCHPAASMQCAHSALETRCQTPTTHPA